MNTLLQDYSLPATCSGVDWHPYLHFDAGHDTRLLNSLFIQEMAKRSVQMRTSFYINEAHGETELEETLSAMRDVFLIIRNALDAEILPDLIETIPQVDLFRRLVK